MWRIAIGCAGDNNKDFGMPNVSPGRFSASQVPQGRRKTAVSRRRLVPCLAPRFEPTLAAKMDYTLPR